MKRQKTSGIITYIVLIISICFMAALSMRINVSAATYKVRVTMRAGQNIILNISKAAKEPEYKITGGRGRVRELKQAGRFRALKTGDAVISAVYKNDVYSFRLTILKKEKNQAAAIKASVSAKGIVTISSGRGGRQTKLASVFLGTKYAEKNVIMVGDSRFVGMHYAVGGRATWIAAVGEGHSWLQYSVRSRLRRMKVKHKVIVFNLGVNDLGYSRAYIRTMTALGAELKRRGAEVYFMTVNPVNRAKEAAYGYSVSNSSIIRFNKMLVSNLIKAGYGVISTYDRLTDNGFSTTDGLHFAASTYRKIYSVLKNTIVSSSPDKNEYPVSPFF